MLASILLALAGLVSLSTAGYVLEDDYSTDQFFSMFDFFTVRHNPSFSDNGVNTDINPAGI